MSRTSPHVISRRMAFAGVAASAGVGLVSKVASAQLPPRTANDSTGPIFDRRGPDAELYGAKEGYPVPSGLAGRLMGNPWPPKYRVGAFSHLDEIYPTRKIGRAAVPWVFKRAAADIRYRFRGNQYALADYLARNPVTGLLIAKDDRILFERYQYDRTDRDRLVSQSMVKSITGVLIGLAIGEGAIHSVDDTAETYVPGFRGSEYGRTPIRDLLHMSSGVDFGEDRDGGRDLNRLWQDLVAGRGGKGTVASIVQFNQRTAPPGTRFAYASIEPDVLGMVLHQAIGKSAAEYLQEKIWKPIGAEADATWLLDAQGYELAHFGFSAVLRDYARLARLLAHDGAWDGRQILPAQWMIDATTVRASDGYLAPGKATADFGYGYLVWLPPGSRRQFAFFGDFGHRICIDPASKLVMVQTALDSKSGEIFALWAALVAQLG